MAEGPVVLACGCSWDGQALDQRCARAKEILARLGKLHEHGQSKSPEYARLIQELEQEHTPVAN